VDKKIVVGYDGSSNARPALSWALDEAARTGASTEILYADDWLLRAPANSAPIVASSPGIETRWPDGRDQRDITSMLTDAVTAARETHPSVFVTATTVWAYPPTALITRSADARLIVIGSRGQLAVTALRGSVSTVVCAHVRCPVAVIRGTFAATAPVVAGVDGSSGTASVLCFAAVEASARQVPLRVIRVWSEMIGRRADIPMVAQLLPRLRRGRFDTLVTGIRSAFPDLVITIEALIDHPADALTSASTAAQLVVVGKRGQGAVPDMLLGSVSRHLLRHAACPLAIVPDPSGRL
jgi:nucleotide-binding universal stress UspA family protein